MSPPHFFLVVKWLNVDIVVVKFQINQQFIKMKRSAMNLVLALLQKKRLRKLTTDGVRKIAILI